jgi:N-acylneuraminate cytidylyltransferase
MVNRLLIIPAKSNSKRIPGKNFKKFFKKKIIEYSIDTAINSKLFNTIHISTDKFSNVKEYKSKKIINIDFLRPKKLCSDKTGLLEVLKFVQKKFINKNKSFDEIWCLLPCAPLIDKDDLIKASKFFSNQKKTPVLSVTEFPVPIDWAFNLNSYNKLQPVFKKKHEIPSQNFKKYYYDSGLFCIFSSDFLLKKHNNLYGSFRGYVISREKAVDIDNYDDWNLALKIFKSRKV